MTHTERLAELLDTLDSISRSLTFACDVLLVQDTARDAAQEIREMAFRLDGLEK